MPTIEVLAEVMEENGSGMSVATVDCTVYKSLCTDRHNVRVCIYVLLSMYYYVRYIHVPDVVHVRHVMPCDSKVTHYAI